MSIQSNNATQPLIRFPVGVSDFRALVTEQYRFADKTEFVKEIMEDGAKVILLTRPRRFGKTLNMSMLHYFLQLDAPQHSQLFDDLKISQHKDFCQQHQQKYPVIFISLKDIKCSSFERAYEEILLVIQNLYSEHRYLLNDAILESDERATFEAMLSAKATPAQIGSSIKRLSEYLQRKFGKPAVILIDEYDTPIQEAYLQQYYKEMVELMRGMLGKALKDNTAMYKAVLTGITRVSQESLFSGLNNLDVYSLLRNEYSQYFGFTEQEVVALSRGIELESNLDGIRAWYNGYRIGNHMIYNPWSIISCLKNKGALKPYWLNTSSNGLIQKLLEKADAAAMRGDFYRLLQGETITKELMENLIFPDLDRKEDAIWSLLLYAGYLNVLSKELGAFQLMAEVAVPNREVMFVYNEIVTEWFRRGAARDDYYTLIRSLVNGEMDEFKRCVGDYLMESGSYFDFNRRTSEQVFQVFMLGLVVGLKQDYIIQANRESGRGRLDVIFIPRNKNLKGIVLEFKTCEEPELMQARAVEALQQIKDKQYIQSLKQDGVRNVLIVGMAFCGKQVELAHENVRVE